jgi:hypothetical protein
MNNNNAFNKYLKNGDYSNNINNNNNNTLQIFLSLIIIGYFGIKIVYSTFFKYFPDKFYYKTIEINKNDDKAIISSYVPNQWNNEFTDFITLLTLCFIIYVFSNFASKNIISKSGVISPSFLIGFIIGLGFPIYKKNVLNIQTQTQTEDENKNINLNNNNNFIIGFILSIIAIIAIVSNYSNGDSMNVSIYLVTIFMLLFGLYFTRKKTETKLTTKVYNTKNDKCASATSGIIQTSGEKLNINIPFISFIILLLFKNDPSNNSFRYAVYLLFGLLLGIFVSSVSYFGIEYFLEKTPEKVCENIEECDIKEMKYNNKSFYTIIKEYIKNIINKDIPDESKKTLEDATEIIDTDYANNINKQNTLKTINKSFLQKIGEKLGFVKKVEKIVKDENITTVDVIKGISLTLLLILVLFIIYTIIESTL